MMLGREKFIKYMTELKGCVERHDRLAKLISKISDDGWILPLNIKEEELIVDLLSDLTWDRDDAIIYYIYELRWGRDGKDCLYDEETDEYTSLETLDELYDYIVRSHEEGFEEG